MYSRGPIIVKGVASRTQIICARPSPNIASPQLCITFVKLLFLFQQNFNLKKWNGWRGNESWFLANLHHKNTACNFNNYLHFIRTFCCWIVHKSVFTWSSGRKSHTENETVHFNSLWIKPDMNTRQTTINSINRVRRHKKYLQGWNLRNIIR